MYKVYYNDSLIFGSVWNREQQILSPTIDMEWGKAGNFNFIILPNHPMYDSLKKMEGIVQVFDPNENSLFRGRILSTETDFYNQKTIYCEGDLTFLIDSPQSPRELTGTMQEILQNIINEHNSFVEQEKKFTIGHVDSVAEVSVNIITYQNTKTVVENEIIGVYGGYFRTRYENGIAYLDYYLANGGESDQYIQFAKNLIDLNNNSDFSDVFTVLLPVGDDNLTIETVNNGSKEIVVHPNMPKIIKIETFTGITDANELLKAANNYIDTYGDYPEDSLELTAIDLSDMGLDYDRIRIGDLVSIQSKINSIDKKSICMSIHYDFFYPGNTTFSFGKAQQTLSKNYASNQQSNNKNFDDINSNLDGTQRDLGSTKSKLDNYISVTDGVLDLHAEQIELNAQKITANAEEIEVNATKITANANAIALNAQSIVSQGNQITSLGNTIETHAQLISNNALQIENNATLITNNANRIVTNATNIETNATNIQINANRIVEINAEVVKVNGKIDAESADIRKFFSGQATAASFTATNLSAITASVGTLKIGNATCKWISTEVVTGVSYSTSGQFNVMLYPSGGSRAVNYVRSVSSSSTTITYLGF